MFNIFHQRKMVIHQAKKGKGKKNKSYHVQCLKTFVKIESKNLINKTMNMKKLSCAL
jgi:hypothetical protein